MAVIAIRTGRMRDAALVSIFRDLSEQLSSNNVKARSGGVAIDLLGKDVPETFGDRSELITHVEFGNKDNLLRVFFRRGIAPNLSEIEVRQASINFDEFYIITPDAVRNQAVPTVDEIAAADRIIRKRINPIRNKEAEAATETPMALLQTQFSELSVLYERLLNELDEKRRAFDQETSLVRNQMAAELAEKRNELEAEEERGQQRLQDLEAELVARAKDLDDRDHMHARRGLREKITTDIQGRLSQSLVPKTARWLRWILPSVMLLGSGALAVLAFISLLDFTTYVASPTAPSSQGELTMTWYLLIRGSLASIGAVFFLLYAIRWMARIYDEDVTAHRTLERYSSDVDRASWAIETILEAQTREGVTLPDQLLAGVSHGLFAVPGQRDLEGQADALTALLSASARAKIGPQGAEFELNNRGSSKLAKAIEGGDK